MKCTACGKEHSRKDVLYTEDRLPYCPNPFTCNDEHPNSTKNILARQGAVQMFTEEELEDNIYNNLNVSPEMKERINKIATKPQSIRLSKVDIAFYLIQLQDTMNFNSLSEAIRFCVIETSKNYPIDGAMLNLDVADNEVEQPEPEVHEVVEHEVLPEIKEEEPPSESEFTF